MNEEINAYVSCIPLYLYPSDDGDLADETF